jgi:hypothetical protein
MSQHQEPPRLLDLGGIPPSLAESLRAAGRDGLEEASVARVAAGVVEGIGSAGASGAGSAGAGAMAGKVAAGVVGVGILVGGLWLAARSGGPQETVVDSALTMQSAQPPAVVASGVASAMASGTAKVEAVPTSRPVVSPGVGMSAASSLAEEHRLLRAARSALAAAPARALALTREHERRFPRGVLAQEREVIAIQALAAMGEGEAARKKADGFDEKYPDSPHRRGVGEVVDP